MLLLSFYPRSYFRVSSRRIKNKSMIIGVSPFPEAVPGKSSLESLESKSYAILRGLRVPRTEVARRCHACPLAYGLLVLLLVLCELQFEDVVYTDNNVQHQCRL